MATYTMPLKEVIEFTGGTITYEDVTFEDVKYNLPVLIGGNIGLAHYPLFNDGYRNVLNGKIIDRYWNREIGLETIDDFQLAMRRKMNEIMPFYNKLYESERIAYDALSTVDISTESETNAEGVESVESTTSSNNDTESRSRSVSSATPQTMLAGNEDYATGAADVNSANETVSTADHDSAATRSDAGESQSRTTGYQGVASDLIVRYRESLLNIDLMVLRDIEDCFMLLLNNSDSYTRQRWWLW